MAVSTFKKILNIEDDEYAFVTEDISIKDYTRIPLYIPTLMTYITQAEPRICSKPLENTSIYRNSEEIGIAVNRAVQEKNYLEPTYVEASSLESYANEDGIIPKGTRVVIAFPYQSIRERNLGERKE